MYFNIEMTYSGYYSCYISTFIAIMSGKNLLLEYTPVLPKIASRNLEWTVLSCSG